MSNYGDGRCLFYTRSLFFIWLAPSQAVCTQCLNYFLVYNSSPRSPRVPLRRNIFIHSFIRSTFPFFFLFVYAKNQFDTWVKRLRERERKKKSPICLIEICVISEEKKQSKRRMKLFIMSLRFRSAFQPLEGETNDNNRKEQKKNRKVIKNSNKKTHKKRIKT